MPGPVSGEGRRAPSRLRPWLAVSSLAALALVLTVRLAPETPVHTLVDLPDRFSRIVLEPSAGAAEAPVPAALPAPSQPPQARAVTPPPRATAGPAAPAERPSSTRDQVRSKSKLLGKLIGTRGESSSVAGELWSDEDRGLGDIDGALAPGGTDASALGGLHGPGGGKAGAVSGSAAGDLRMAGQPKPASNRQRYEGQAVASGPGFEGGPLVVAEVDPLSTFSIDVDTASWTRTVSRLRAGQRPQAREVRVEEFVNAFHYDYDAPTDGRAFAVHAQAAPSPWDDELHLLRIGLQAREVAADDVPPVNLTFLVDTSCSMQRYDKLPLVTASLHRLVDRLRPEDSVAIVTYAGSSEIVLGRTSAAERTVLHGALDTLRPQGGTAMADGIYTAYELASDALDVPATWAGLQLPMGGRVVSEAVHRVVLVSDGDANIGDTDPQGILPAIRDHAARGITLTALGVGSLGYRDDMMEQLADEGDGAYHFLADQRDADRVLGRDLTSTLHVVARDTKIQVAFDPDVVGRYRLIGYDNRRLRNRDFRDDTVDAGEVGSGHQVTALYEVELIEPGAPLGEVRLRYKPPGPDAPSQEVVATMGPSTVPSLEHASSSMQASVAVAGLARVLRLEDGFDGSDVPGLERLARSGGIDPTRAEELGDVFRALR